MSATRAPAIRVLPDAGSRRRRTIVVVVHDFALGGTERIAVRLAGAWARAGNDVRIVAGAATGPLIHLVDPRVTIVVPPQPVARARGSVGRLGRMAAAYLASQPADCCFVPGNYHWPVAAAVARLPAATRPRILVQVSAALHKPQRRRIAQVVYDLRMRYLLRSTDAVLVMSDRARREAAAILCDARVVLMPLPALDDRVRRPVVTDASNRHIVAAGRLVPEKGFATLIAAFAAVAVDDPAAALTIVGNGPERGRLGALALSLGVADRVAFPGYVADIRPWLDRARLFVLSSHFEGYGGVIIEALAAGRPVVATDCTPATVELLFDRAAGAVVPIGDPAAMAAAIRHTLDAPVSDPFRLAALVDHHRIGPVAAAHTALMDALASPARRAGSGRGGVPSALPSAAEPSPQLPYLAPRLDEQTMR